MFVFIYLSINVDLVFRFRLGPRILISDLNYYEDFIV